MGSYTIKQGDHLSRIAQQNGFFDYRTVWDHPQNSELKKKRVNPNVLMPGDVLFIPEKKAKALQVSTGAKHVFKITRSKLYLRIAVVDFDNKPVANVDCELKVDERTYRLKTDAKGRIEQPIEATSENGVLRIPSLEMELPVKIGHLDPADEGTGWRQRLINLGYHPRALADDDATMLRHAVEEFQCDHGLKVTGDVDAVTKAKLKQEHGC
jgi:N-acetylmuramoyl-L-alanine amidase